MTPFIAEQVASIKVASGNPIVGQLCDSHEELRKERDEARAELAELRRISRAQGNDIVHTNAVLDWTMDALRGEAVSDFAESFPEVRAAKDFRAEADRLRQKVADLGGSLAACRDALGDQAGERLYESIAALRARVTAMEKAHDVRTGLYREKIDRIEALEGALRSVVFEGLATDGYLIPSPKLTEALSKARALLGGEK